MSCFIYCTAGGKKHSPKKAAGPMKNPTKKAVTNKEDAADATREKQGRLTHRLLVVQAEACSGLLIVTEP